MSKIKESTQELDHAALARAHRKRARRYKALFLALIVHLSLVVGVTEWGSYDQHHHVSQVALAALQQTLGTNSAKVVPQTIQSTAGFSVTYNTSTVNAQGVVLPDLATNSMAYSTGKGAITLYNSQDLNTVRDYGAIDFWTSGSTKDTALIKTNPVWQMEITTNLQANIFSDGRKVYGQSISDLDLTQKLFAPTKTTTSYNTIVPSLTQTTSVVISGVTYRKIVYTMTDTTFSSASYSQVQYLTVQNGRPYAIKLDITPTTQGGDVSLLMQAFAGLRYTQPSKSGLVGFVTDMSEVKAASASLPNQSINLPNQLDTSTLELVAKNQPGVVRVATITCYNFNLLLPGGSVIGSFQGVCGAEIGSGSIISGDGYIATNGHVVMPLPSDAFQLYITLAANAGNAQPLRTYINYLVASHIASGTQINSLITSVKAGDNNAAQTLLNLTASIPNTDYQVTSKHSDYAIQLATEPIKLNQSGTDLTFTYDQSVLAASMVGFNFDVSQDHAGKVNLDTYGGTDVAVLKMQGNNFPVIPLGSANDVGFDSVVTAIGFPGFVDGGLEPTKDHTIPTATQGNVSNVAPEPAGTYKLITSTVPIAQGNSGGPGLDDQGLEIGLTTYSTANVDPQSGIEKLSDGGVLRNIDDIKALLVKENVHLMTASQVTTLWDQDVNDFSTGHYKKAVVLSNQILTLYPQQYLATSFLTAAQKEVLAGNDVGSFNGLMLAGVGLGAVWLIAIPIVGIMYLSHRRHGAVMGYNQPLQTSNVVAIQPTSASTPNVVVMPQTEARVLAPSTEQQPSGVQPPEPPVS